MKLALPKTLLAAVLACFALQGQTAATETIIINNYKECDTLFTTPWIQIDAADSNLQLNGDHKPFAWDADYGTYEGVVNIDWSGSSGKTYSMSGSGTLGAGQIMISKDDETSSSGNVTFNIGSGIKLHDNVVYAVGEGVVVNFAGSIDGSLDAMTYLGVDEGGVMNLNKADLSGGDVCLDFMGGTIVKDSYRVEGNNGIGGHGIYISLAEGGVSNVFSGNLTLASGGFVEFENCAYQETGATYGSLHVDGTLTIEGAAQLLFAGSWDHDAMTVTTEKPAVGSVLLTAKDLKGANKLNQLKLYGEEATVDAEEYDYEDADFTADLSDSIHLGYTFTDGLYEIKVYAGATVGGGSDDNSGSGSSSASSNVITNGKVEGALSSSNLIKLSEGAVVDATGATNLSNAYISGTGGTLKTNATQSIRLSGVDTLGFSVVGNGTGAAAALVVGSQGGNLGDAAIWLEGSKYESDTIDVLSGQLNTGEGTKLGTADSLLTVGTEGATGTETTASVNNFGTVAGDVVVNTCATMDNRGMVEGDVTLASGAWVANNGVIQGTTTVDDGARLQGSGTYNGVHLLSGARMHIGNSPGYSTVADLTLEGGSTLSFTVDGIKAATAEKNGSGTYSQLRVTNSLTFNGLTNAEIEITKGILAAGAQPFTVKLLDATGATVTDNSGEEGFMQYTVTEGLELIKDDYELVMEEDGSLSFTATVDPVAAAALLSGDGHAIANTLWSSTSGVRSFARTATSQLGVPATDLDGVTIWGAGLGDFVSMDGFSSSSSGYAVGIDRQFRYDLRMGLAFGQMFGDFKSDASQTSVDQMSLMAGLYIEYVSDQGEGQDLKFTTWAAYGNVDNDADTMVAGLESVPGRASWNDNVFAAGTRAEWVFQVSDTTTLAPFVGVEYIYGMQGDFTETFGKGMREYQHGSMQALSIPVGITARTRIALDETQKLLPELTLAYVGDAIRTNPHVDSTVYGISTRHKGVKPGRNAFMLNAGTHWVITENWSTSAFYNLEVRSKAVGQEANISVRYAF